MSVSVYLFCFSASLTLTLTLTLTRTLTLTLTGGAGADLGHGGPREVITTYNMHTRAYLYICLLSLVRPYTPTHLFALTPLP